jgi:multidrug efflux pump subunit AcrA (membrane-fusion protein)
MKSLSALRSALIIANDRLAAQPQKHRWLVGGAILLGSVMTSTVIFATAPSAVPEIPREKAWPVSVLTIAPAALSPMFDTFGKVEATRIARIQTDLVADIATVAVREGQWVTKGDVLVVLEPAMFELAVRERDAELARERAVLMRVQTQWKLTKESTGYFQSKRDTSRAKLRRYEGLFQKGMVAQSLLDEVTDQASAAGIEYQTHRLALADFPNQIAEHKARVDQALSSLGRAQLDLDHATLHAPFSGPVLSVAASPGNHTALGQPLVEIADAEGLEVRVPVPDVYSAAVRKHLANGVAITARTGSRTGSGTDSDEGGIAFVLARLAGNVREGHSGIDSFFRVAVPTKSALEIGRVLKLSITLPAEDDVVALPVQSIYENDRIYQVVDDRLQALTVERIGDHANDAGEYRVLVRGEDLHAGARIITTQLPKAISGLRVQPVG